MRGTWQKASRSLVIASGALIATGAAVLAAPITTPTAPVAATAPCAGPQFTCVPVTWDPGITSKMSWWILNPPTTTSTLGTPSRRVDFAMLDAYLELRPGMSSTKSGLVTTNATAMHLIVNTSSTPASAANTANGTVTVTYTDNTTTVTSLVVANNNREWEIGNPAVPAAVAVLTSPTATNAWTGQSTALRTAVLDMVMVPLKGTVQPKSVTVTNTSGFGLSWFGLTIENTPPAPPVVVPPANQTGHYEGQHADPAGAAAGAQQAGQSGDLGTQQAAGAAQSKGSSVTTQPGRTETTGDSKN